MRFSESDSGMRNFREATYSSRLRCSRYSASTSSAAEAGGAGGLCVITRERTFFAARGGTAEATSLGFSSNTAAFPSGDSSVDRSRLTDLRLMTRYHDQPRGAALRNDGSLFRSGTRL